MNPFLSVVVPVRNDPENLAGCLDALERSEESSVELIVVDDGSTDDDSVAVAEDAGARVLRLPRRRGPAHARNLGAKEARGEVLVFLDADVEVRPDTLTRMRERFESDPELTALFGSYDRSPAGQNLLSQYRNLLHHYTHQRSSEDAFTFWSGCGAIRRDAFLEVGGFENRFHHPAIEDIELGQRLSSRKRRIRLCRDVQVCHRKIWRLAGMTRTDLLQRGVPWTREIHRLGKMPADLNLRYSDRFLTGLALVLTVLLAAAVVRSPLWLLAPPWILLWLAVADRGSSPGSGLAGTRWWPLRLAAVLESLGLLALIWHTPRTLPLVAGGALCFLCFAVLRADFYRILCRVRGVAFLFLAFQAHVLFYWICGLAFALGTVAHWIAPLAGEAPDGDEGVERSRAAEARID